MRYRIGELADFFGMTKEGIRYLEREGVITSERDAGNGYRYFPRDEITRLKQIKRYQGLGFSLEEAHQLVCETRREEIVDRLAQKQRELEGNVRQIERMQRLLAMQQEAAAHLIDTQEQVWLGERPELIFFPRVPDEASGETPAQREAIARARAEEKEWILATPPCTLGAMHFTPDGTGRRMLGSIVRAESAREVGLRETERTIHLPACPCVCAVVEGPEKQRPDLSPLFDYMRANRLRITGEVFGILWLTYRTEQGNRFGIHEVYAPYEKMEEDGTMTAASPTKACQS